MAFREAQTSNAKTVSAEIAQKLHDLLRKDFFYVYHEFNIRAIDLHKSISKFLDKRIPSMKRAAINFFKLDKFKGQNPTVEFEETNSGTRSAVICNVTVNSTIQTYRIKTNHNAGESGRGNVYF